MSTVNKEAVNKVITEEMEDLKKCYDIPEDERHDIIPEMWEGAEGRKNADFVDPDIEKVSVDDFF
jgi:hypothetical protein